ncbi:MAG TPA: T9SS type A sorting domain-containing protein, partial [Bacteroidota bacterium]|nr:T9SS type A sorting domain-containing protein [Bacteroidota bacterium]
QSVTFTVPSVASGSYYMGALVDINNAVTESDETNNGGVRNGLINVSPGNLQQSISLQTGWNMVSGYVIPQQSTMDSVFKSILSNVVIVKNGAGLVYWPAYSINQIGNWQYKDGYQVYMKAAGTLTLSGQGVTPASAPIPLAQGWSLFAYSRSSQMDITQALTTIADAVVIVKNNAGQVYWPSYSINQIGSMQPGQGYLAYLSKKDTLTYPANSSSGIAPPEKVVAISRVPKHFIPPASPTVGSATVLLFLDAAHDGDEIAAFAGGRLVGSGVVESGKCAFAIWGDDPLTPDVVDGAVGGESIALEAWDAVRDVETPVSVVSTSWVAGRQASAGSITYQENSALVVYGQVDVQIVPTSVSLEQNYPNPFNPSTTIKYSVPSEEHVSLELYDVLGQRVGILVDKMEEAGVHEVVFDASHLATGVYIYRLVAGSSTITKKLLLTK